MENVDLVLIGAEGVVESGGIINKVTIVSIKSWGDKWHSGKRTRLIIERL